MATDQGVGVRRTVGLLLDVRFRSRATRSLLPALYLTVLVLVALTGVGAVIAATVQAWWLGLLALVVIPLFVLVAAAAARVGCELVWAVSELNEHVGGIAERLPRLESVIDDLARDMPKLGFLRRGANGRERAPAGSDEIS
jgi:hypothetical protein